MRSNAMLALLLAPTLARLSVGQEGSPAAAAETFGCEANPTGDPLGGGAGYRRTVSGGEREVTTAEELVQALRTATPGTVVFVPGGVELDLTGMQSLPLRGGVTLASDRGRDGSPGALLSTTEDRATPRGSERFELFVTEGPDVRVTGLRLRGPDGARRNRYDYLNSDGIVALHDHLEVDNCEVFDWSHGGVFARRGAGHRVHHCEIHHCQRQGLGYGVVLDVAEVLVEANRFDWCRHAIAGTGRTGSGYEARWNEVGEHANGHLFDMHGGRDRKDGTQLAGDWIRIHHNTFRCASQYAFVLRGVTRAAAEFHHNRFPYSGTIRAVRQLNAQGRLAVGENLFGDG